MSKIKILLITTIILGAMLSAAVFGFGLLSELFLLWGILFGISALIWLSIYLKWKAGKKTNLIPIGLNMAFFGLAYLCMFNDAFHFINIPLSVLYTVAGLLTLVKGIKDWNDAKRNRIQTTNGTANNSCRTVQVKNEYCARCGKNLSYVGSTSVFEIDGTKYCSDCNVGIERDKKIQHMVCSVCGVELRVENMNVIDDALLCHTCFLKKYGNIDSYGEE